jgi:subfamily B ATP-binding cassette protein HlyB/CyaB
VLSLGNTASQAVQLVNKLATAAILFFGAKLVIDGSLTKAAFPAGWLSVEVRATVAQSWLQSLAQSGNAVAPAGGNLHNRRSRRCALISASQP